MVTTSIRIAPESCQPLGSVWWISSRLRGAQLPPRGVVVAADPTPGSATPPPCETTPGSPLARHGSTRHSLLVEQTVGWREDHPAGGEVHRGHDVAHEGHQRVAGAL